MSCRETSKKKIFVYEEKRSKLSLHNIDEVKSISVKVDGCEIDDDTIRCDYLHIAKNVESFIELKGQDLKHAIAQLINSIRRLSANPSTQTKVSYIICTRSPLSSAEIQNYKIEFRKKFNSELKIKSSPHSEKY